MWTLVLYLDMPACIVIGETGGSTLYSHRHRNFRSNKIKLSFNKNLKVNGMANFGELWIRSDTCDERPCVCVWTLVPTFVPCVHIPRIHISFSACFHNLLLFLRVYTDAILITLRGRFTVWCYSARDTYALTQKPLLNATLFTDTKPSFAKLYVVKCGRGFLKSHLNMRFYT
jgi:hypothetical protein